MSLGGPEESGDFWLLVVLLGSMGDLKKGAKIVGKP